MSRPQLDAGYIYIMVDTQERADKSTLVKIGMTGSG
jgi:hypothetical protein